MLLFGALFSLFASPLHRTVIFKEPFFWHGVIFTSIFNVAVVYAVVHFPDWMWMYYLQDARNTLPELVYLFAFLYYFPFALGFYLGRDLKRYSIVIWAAFVVVLMATEAWLVLVLFDRYSVIGTRAEFLLGEALPLFGPDNPIGPVMNGSVVGMVLYFILCLILFRRGIRRDIK